MITVLLYGHLRKAFGKMHRFDIRSPAEAIRALSANFPGFRKHLLEHSEPGYHVVVGRNEGRDEKTLTHPADDVIRIIPVVAGSKKNGGVWQTILGIVLIVVGVYFEVPELVYAGISMLVGGIVQLLTVPPKTPGPAENPDNLPSYGFDGAANTSAQGNPVPLFYGEGIVGSQVLSAGLYVESISSPSGGIFIEA
jgi:predicted phage tail protein